jgi:hypothetical protein
MASDKAKKNAREFAEKSVQDVIHAVNGFTSCQSWDVDHYREKLVSTLENLLIKYGETVAREDKIP